MCYHMGYPLVRLLLYEDGILEVHLVVRRDSLEYAEFIMGKYLRSSDRTLRIGRGPSMLLYGDAVDFTWGEGVVCF